MAMNLEIDTLAYTNRLRHLPPQQKLLFALVALAIALLAHPLTQLLLILWISLWIVVYARIPPKIYLRLLALAGLFLLMSWPPLLFNVVRVEKIPLIQEDSWGGVGLGSWYAYIGRDGLQQGLTVGMRSLSCTACLLFVLLTVPLSEVLQVLRQLKVPILFTDLLLLMYRFIFIFLKTAAELGLAQRSRGGYRDRRRLHSLSLLIGQLVWRSLRRYQQFSLGLAARGFTGEFQVYSGRRAAYSKRYALESLVGCGVLIILEMGSYLHV